MLVLTRQVGESVVIGKDVSVRVLRVTRKRVYLAVEAPGHIRVVRKEVRVTGPRRRPPIAEHFGQTRPVPLGDHIPSSVLDSEAMPLSRYCCGLRDAIDRLIAHSEADGGPEIEFCDDLTADESQLELPPQVQTVVFFVVKELLQNACCHSGSSKVLLGLAQDGEAVCIQVQDWGTGFVPNRVGPLCRGLDGVRQLLRCLGGTLDIDSRPGDGTCIVAEVPISP